MNAQIEGSLYTAAGGKKQFSCDGVHIKTQACKGVIMAFSREDPFLALRPHHMGGDCEAWRLGHIYIYIYIDIVHA